MKKLLIVLFLMSFGAKAQDVTDVFVSATNQNVDGYVTAGYIKGSWGIFLGTRYDDKQPINYAAGTASDKMKYGVIRMLPGRKIMVGVGAQPTDKGTKPNAFIGFAPLKSNDMKLWTFGNIVGDTFSLGLGLSYKLK